MKARIDIDAHSGFCFGVTTAITKAEEELSASKQLFCLGDIVHNSAEMQRLSQKGLQTITHSDLDSLSHVRVLLRAHGEPPSTYEQAARQGITLVDATCPVVLRLQQRIKQDYTEARQQGRDLQIVIYGQPGHAEVNGLVGQTDGTAIVIEGPEQLSRIDMGRDIALYSQTTKSVEGFHEIIRLINRHKHTDVHFKSYDTICRQVANRVDQLRDFASTHSVILFVAGEKSSNGKVLFGHCRQVNQRAYLIANPGEIQAEWFADAPTIGICGATSTPRWLMEEVAEYTRNLLENAEFHSH